MTLQWHYNHYRDRDSDLDLDLDWGVVIYNQIVTWTAFAILAMSPVTTLLLTFEHEPSTEKHQINPQQESDALRRNIYEIKWLRRCTHCLWWWLGDFNPQSDPCFFVRSLNCAAFSLSVVNFPWMRKDRKQDCSKASVKMWLLSEIYVWNVRGVV